MLLSDDSCNCRNFRNEEDPSKTSPFQFRLVSDINNVSPRRSNRVRLGNGLIADGNHVPGLFWLRSLYEEVSNGAQVGLDQKNR